MLTRRADWVSEGPKDSEQEGRVLIWARPERAAKGPVPSRSRSKIAAAAVALADADGLESVSMRKVAAALGIGTASLYGYVLSKDELVDLMVDWVEGEDGPPPQPGSDLRANIIALAQRIRDSILRHPWMASVAGGRPNFGPNSLAWTEQGFVVMEQLQLTSDETLIVSEVLISFVRGFVAREVAEHQALQRAGITSEQWVHAVTPYMDSVVASGEFPRLARVVRDADLLRAANSKEVIFALALERILDGLFPSSR